MPDEVLSRDPTGVPVIGVRDSEGDTRAVGEDNPVPVYVPVPVYDPPAVGVAGDGHQPSVGSAAVVTYAAAAGVTHVISGIYWSYNGSPTVGNIQVTSGGAILFSADITAAGPGHIPFPRPKSGAEGADMVITLAAAGAVTGKCGALNHWTL